MVRRLRLLGIDEKLRKLGHQSGGERLRSTGIGLDSAHRQGWLLALRRYVLLGSRLSLSFAHHFGSRVCSVGLSQSSRGVRLFTEPKLQRRRKLIEQSWHYRPNINRMVKIRKSEQALMLLGPLSQQPIADSFDNLGLHHLGHEKIALRKYRSCKPSERGSKKVTS